MKLYHLVTDYEELELLVKALDAVVDQDTDGTYTDLVMFRSQCRRKLQEATRDYVSSHRVVDVPAPVYADIDMTLAEFSSASID